MEPVSNHVLAALIRVAALADRRSRQKTRGKLIEALRADGYSSKDARKLSDRFIRECRQARAKLRQSQVNN